MSSFYKPASVLHLLYVLAKFQRYILDAEIMENRNAYQFVLEITPSF